MKILSSVLAVIVAALIFLLLRQNSATQELQASVDVMAKERDSFRGELQKVNRQVADLRRAAAIKTEEAPKPVVAEKPAVAERPAEPVARPGVSVTAPAGWWKNGKDPEKYVVGVDSLQTWGGMPSAYVESLGEAKGSFGGMMQTTAAENYSGKRVRLNAWLKTEEANDGGGHLWLRIDGQEQGKTLGFDNMDNRPAKGTSDWQEASVVLDVPAGAKSLAYGFFVSGKGKMWVSGQTLNEVGADVPTTNMLKARPPEPKAPTNLGFDPKQAK
jgi:hypothetical protein